MSSITTLYLVRHGESESNQSGLVSGRKDDPDLTEEGRLQVAKTAQHLKKIGHQAVYTSDLKRAIQTAEIIHGQEIPSTRRSVKLREKDFGEVDGQPKKHLEDIYYAVVDLPEAERWDYRHNPTAETDREVADRFLAELGRIAELHKGEIIIIVSHGICIRTALMHLGYAKHEDFPPGSFANAGYAVLKYADDNFEVDQVVGHNKNPSK